MKKHEAETYQTAGTEHARDPLGLGQLPAAKPIRDDWKAIRSALETDGGGLNGNGAARAPLPGTLPALALAASLLLVAGLVLWLPERTTTGAGVHEAAPVELATAPPPQSLQSPAEAGALTSDDAERSREQLIALSQGMEQRLRLLREQVGYLPADSALYVAELEDLIARVDGQLGASPDSLDLWSQRVNLMLDLEVVFQHQFDREYGRMASL